MCFVQFFKILNFWVVMGIKEQKTVQNDKQFCPSRFISQEPYIIWLSFMVHLHKMISPGLFSFYQNFEFLGCSGGKRAKNGPKWQKIMSVALHIWGTVHHMTVIYVCKMMISLGIFSYLFIFFFSILIFWVHRVPQRAQNGPEWQKIMSLALHISETIHHMTVIYGANV